MDNKYLKLVREGDSEAFSYLVEKYSSKSYSLALSIVKNEAEAEEIVQTAFIKAYKAIPTFREEAKFSTWLYRIIVNECQALIRKKKNKFSEIAYHTGNAAEEKADDKILNNEKKKILGKAISGLKAKEALLIRLYYLCELNHEEIREVTGYSISNSKVILHRARKNLKEILEVELADEINSIR